jgi:hypothetical protein
VYIFNPFLSAPINAVVKQAGGYNALFINPFAVFQNSLADQYYGFAPFLSTFRRAAFVPGVFWGELSGAPRIVAHLFICHKAPPSLLLRPIWPLIAF